MKYFAWNISWNFQHYLCFNFK